MGVHSYEVKPEEGAAADVRARERERMVKWMRGVLAEKPDVSSQKAFLAKVNGVVTHHGITLEELLNGDSDPKP